MTASPRRLGAAPHRILFFAGASNLLLAMVWWAGWLVAARWPGAVAVPYPPVFPGWLHAFVMQYQVLPAFVFGFLLTTFPKWMKQPEVTRRRFIPVGGALIVGQLVTLAGALGSRGAIVAGVALTLAAWLAALSVLVPMLWREDGTTWHARSCVAALVLGCGGIVAFAAYLAGASPAWIPRSTRIGTYGMLLPIYVTVAHRMFPFFASNVVAGYQPWRPMWLLAALWAAAIVRLGLDLLHADAWLWIGDGALLGLTAFALLRWWPRGAKPALLTVLFVGLAWLPAAMALSLVDSVGFAVDGTYRLGRAPAHALFIGFFGSVLVAMVTRVTLGHSGRPLVMPGVAWYAFVAIQVVAVARIAAETMADPYAWLAGSAVGWLVALAPWAARLGAIYLSPRSDGKPG